MEKNIGDGEAIFFVGVMIFSDEPVIEQVKLTDYGKEGDYSFIVATFHGDKRFLQLDKLCYLKSIVCLIGKDSTTFFTNYLL